MQEILDGEASRPILESYIPYWENTPIPMRDMPMVVLMDTPFVRMSEEEQKAFYYELKEI